MWQPCIIYIYIYTHMCIYIYIYAPICMQMQLVLGRRGPRFIYSQMIAPYLSFNGR